MRDICKPDSVRKDSGTHILFYAELLGLKWRDHRCSWFTFWRKHLNFCGPFALKGMCVNIVIWSPGQKTIWVPESLVWGVRLYRSCPRKSVNLESWHCQEIVVSSALRRLPLFYGKLSSIATPPKLDGKWEVLASSLSGQIRMLPELSIWSTASTWANWRATSCRTCVCVLSHFSRVWLSETLWTVVHGMLQGRTLECVAVPSSRGSSWPRDRTLLRSPGRWVLYQ